MWALPEAFDIKPGALVAIVGGGGKTSLLFALARALPGRVVVTTTTRIFAAQMKLATAVCWASDLSQLGDQLAQHGICLVIGETQGDKAVGVDAALPGQLLARADVDYVLVEADGSRMRPIKAPADHEPVLPPETTLLVPVVGIDALAGPIGQVAHRPERVSQLTGLAETAVLTPTAVAQLIAHPHGGRQNAPPTARIIPLINKVEDETQLAQARQTAQALLAYSPIDRVVIGAVRQAQPVQEVHRRVTAVVLAAGQGTRMGQTAKQLLPWGETTVLGQTLRHLRQTAVANHIRLVSGHQAAQIEAVAAAEGVEDILFNPHYAAGEMLSSLQTAVASLPDAVAAVLVLLADQPMVTPAMLTQLLTAYWQGKGELIAPVFAGRRGNPVLIGRRYFAELLALPPGDAPRTLLQRHQAALHLEPMSSDAVLQDLDTPADYERQRPLGIALK